MPLLVPLENQQVVDPIAVPVENNWRTSEIDCVCVTHKDMWAGIQFAWLTISEGRRRLAYNAGQRVVGALRNGVKTTQRRRSGLIVQLVEANPARPYPRRNLAQCARLSNF